MIKLVNILQEDNILDKLPLGIQKLFMSRDEKEKLRTSQELEQWAKNNNLSPDRAKAMAAVLAKVDPDTGRIPTGVNTGNVDESKFDDIKASPDKFTNWEYKDPKNLSLARRIVSKGRNANEAALYVAMRYPEYPDLNPQYLKDTGVVVSVIDKFVEAIYDGKTEAPERGETPYFMKETKNKTKMNKKDLMEMIREVIAQEMDKVNMASIVLGTPGNWRTIASLTPDEFVNIKDERIQYSGKQLKDMLIPFASIRSDDEMKKSIESNLDDNIRYEVEKIENTLRILPQKDKIDPNPRSHKNVTENKTKMKVNQLRQIIREEISKVLNEAEGNYTIVSWRGPFGDSYPKQMDSETAMALAKLGTTNLSGKTVPAAEWMSKLKGITPTGKLGDWLESSMGEDLNITIDPEEGKVTLKRESELADARAAIDSREKADRAASLARMGLK